MLKINKILNRIPSLVKTSEYTINQKLVSFPFQQTYVSNLLNISKASFSSKSIDRNESDFVRFIFVLQDKKELPVMARVGESILAVAHKNKINLQGACESASACSTCHIILERDIYDNLPLPRPKEEDVLELTAELTETSRLGCQVFLTKEFEGKRIFLPRYHINLWNEEGISLEQRYAEQ